MSFGLMYGEKYGDSEGKQYTNSINGERFVYYQRLARANEEFTDKDFIALCEKIYKKASGLVRYRFAQAADSDRIAMYFKGLRDAEYAKEKQLLESKLGKTINYDYEDEEMGAILVKGINELLNFKEVFKRNYRLIVETKGQKQLITFFDTYFNKLYHYKRNQDKLMEEVERNLKAGLDLETSVRNALNLYIPDIVRQALEYMFTKAKAENGLKNRQQYDEAYKELAPFLKKGNKAGDIFVKNFIESYGLDDIVSNLKDLTKENYKDMLKSSSFKLGEYTMHSKGGLASENLGTFVADVVANEILKLNNATAIHTGSTSQKADFMVSFDLDTSFVEDWISKNAFGDRDKNTKAAYALNEALKNVDSGFLVLANAKNYTLNNKNDFSAGEKVNLETWDTMMHNVHKRGRDLIFMALQTIKGAVGEDEKENISKVFARAIASALFDDFTTIGEAMPKNRGAKSIHVLYLNGIYLPISFYFNLLYKAFEAYSKESVNKLIRVNINTPREILWPTQTKEEAWKSLHPGVSPWNYQSHKALSEITIEYHFFKSFKTEMEKLNLDL